MHSYRHQLPALADAGYRAVAPTMRGYEPSSQITGNIEAYHPLRIAKDVIAWARELGEGKEIQLVGHDWGAIVGFLAIQLEPKLFRSYCAVAVPDGRSLELGLQRYPIQLLNSWYTLFFQLRGFSDWWVEANEFAFLEKLWRDWSPGWKWEPEEMQSLKQTFSQPGVLESALAYYRAMLNPFLLDSKRARKMSTEFYQVPVMMVTGEQDGCMDTRLFDCVDTTQFNMGYRLERIEGAGHFVHQERPEIFNELLLDWFKTSHG